MPLKSEGYKPRFESFSDAVALKAIDLFRQTIGDLCIVKGMVSGIAIIIYHAVVFAIFVVASQDFTNIWCTKLPNYQINENQSSIWLMDKKKRVL